MTLRSVRAPSGKLTGRHEFKQPRDIHTMLYNWNYFLYELEDLHKTLTCSNYKLQTQAIPRRKGKTTMTRKKANEDINTKQGTDSRNVKEWNQSRPQRPRSFWSAPGIETSGLNLKPGKKTAKSHWLLKLLHFNHNLQSTRRIKPEPENPGSGFWIVQSRCVSRPLVERRLWERDCEWNELPQNGIYLFYTITGHLYTRVSQW